MQAMKHAEQQFLNDLDKRLWTAANKLRVDFMRKNLGGRG
jgi:hypothetical protein